MTKSSSIDEWVKVFSSPHLHQAELLKGMLAEHEISAVVINKKDSSYIVIGDAELYTRKSDALRAKHLIRKHQA